MTLEYMLKQEARHAEERLSRLYGQLLEDGRLDDVKRAVRDESYRKQLFTEQAVAAANQAIMTGSAAEQMMEGKK